MVAIKLVLVITLFLPLGLTAENSTTFDRASFVAKEGILPYRILFPLRFNPSKKYPLILFLHGAGERGNDNELQLQHGAFLFLREDVRKNFPAVVVFPQCPSNSYWSNVQIENAGAKQIFTFREKGEPTKAMTLLIKLVDHLLQESYFDKSRLYLGGLSMGGMGIFELLSRRPELFAAAFPICGGGSPAAVKNYAKKVSLWIFHGAKDDVVPPDQSEVMVKALKNAGADVKFTLYSNAGHESWEQAFAEPKLLPWLFLHSKK